MPKEIPLAQRLNSGKKPTQPNRSGSLSGSQAGSKSGQRDASPRESLPIVKLFRALPWWSYLLAILAFLTPIVILGSTAVVSNKPIALPKVDSKTDFKPEPTPSPNLSSDNFNAGNKQSIPVVNKSAPRLKSRANLFGHFAYSEAPESSLQAIATKDDGYQIKLRQNAASYFLEMVAAARLQGVELEPISGFRSLAVQKELFFEIGKERNQTPSERAKVSAPPGYSEHHTGYAVDISDRLNPSTNLSTSFERTNAFAWMTKNAAKYGFELSFPPNNPQGVMYEPWHWRFVGDQDSLVTFYRQSERK